MFLILQLFNTSLLHSMFQLTWSSLDASKLLMKTDAVQKYTVVCAPICCAAVVLGDSSFMSCAALHVISDVQQDAAV